MQNNERKRILTLVENGTITTEEALILLEKLAGEERTTPLTTLMKKEAPLVEEQLEQEHSSSEAQQEQEKKSKSSSFEDIFGKAFNNSDTNGKMEDVMNELKSDLSQFGLRMTSLINTTLSKVKGFEDGALFGEKMEFTKSYTFNSDEVNGFDIEVPNGKVTVVKSSDEQVSIDVTIKTAKQEDDDQTKAAILADLVKLSDGKLAIMTKAKFSQVGVTIALPEKIYDIFFVRSFNNEVEIDALQAKVVKVLLTNGTINMHHTTFKHADLKTKNGSIEARFLKGEDLEAETMNGRIYIEGNLNEVEAESVNGHVVITTTSDVAHKVKATTVAGSVELYVPKSLALDGKLSTNFGRFDLGLHDISQKANEESFLQKVVHFDKVITNATVLKIIGESRTGTVLVRYAP